MNNSSFKISLVFVLAFAQNLIADGLPSVPYVYAIGRANRSVDVDSISVEFSLSVRDLKLDNALTVLGPKVDSVYGVLRKFEVADIDISAPGIKVSTRFDYQNDRKFMGYDVVREFTVCIKDKTKYGVITQALLSIPVDGFELKGVSNSKQNKILKELDSEARADALKNAKEMAESMNAVVDSVYAISPKSISGLSVDWPFDSDGRTRAYAQGSSDPFAAPAGAGSGSVSFLIQQINLSREAYIVFLIKPKKGI